MVNHVNYQKCVIYGLKFKIGNVNPASVFGSWYPGFPGGFSVVFFLGGGGGLRVIVRGVEELLWEGRDHFFF